MRDAVFGAVDGTITTFAIVAGAGLSHHVVIDIGLVSLLADGLSMAVADWLGVRTDADNARSDGDGPERCDEARLADILLRHGMAGERALPCVRALQDMPPGAAVSDPAARPAPRPPPPSRVLSNKFEPVTVWARSFAPTQHRGRATLRWSPRDRQQAKQLP
ncbi:VIT1/CCC1 transporter family protein [Roseivivax sp. CAU 1761]